MPFTASSLVLIRHRADLQQIISQHVDLKRCGHNWTGICPFHDEKTPSFHVFSDHYHCFGCGAHGDAIEFLRRHCNIAFSDAVKYLAAEYGIYIEGEGDSNAIRTCLTPKAPTKPQPPSPLHPSPVWQKQATALLEQGQKRLQRQPTLLDKEKPRGLTFDSIVRFKLGWQSENLFLRRTDWELAPEINKDGNQKKLCIPKGVLIPCFDMNGLVIRLKVRRDDWKPGDKFPKYHIVEGGLNEATIFGLSTDGLVLVEAELDAMLIAQEADDLYSIAAIGGASNRPNEHFHRRLNQTTIILYALDFDQAGEKAFRWWHQQYPHLRPWPVPMGKSPCDAWSAGVDLQRWITEGLHYYKAL